MVIDLGQQPRQEFRGIIASTLKEARKPLPAMWITPFGLLRKTMFALPFSLR